VKLSVDAKACEKPVDKRGCQSSGFRYVRELFVEIGKTGVVISFALAVLLRDYNQSVPMLAFLILLGSGISFAIGKFQIREFWYQVKHDKKKTHKGSRSNSSVNLVLS